MQEVSGMLPRPHLPNLKTMTTISVGLLPKVETFVYQRIAKTCSAIVLQLLACFQKGELLFARNC